MDPAEFEAAQPALRWRDFALCMGAMTVPGFSEKHDVTVDVFESMMGGMNMRAKLGAWDAVRWIVARATQIGNHEMLRNIGGDCGEVMAHNLAGAYEPDCAVFT